MKRSTDPSAVFEDSRSKRSRRALPPLDKVDNENASLDCFQEITSAREQARPYLLATAKLPVAALTSTWRTGQNRPLNLQHVQDLCSVFAKGGLARSSEKNYLLVACSAAAVATMREYLKAAGEISNFNGLLGDDSPLSFKYWPEVTDNAPAELMAGQHRVAALRKYVEENGFEEDELWWTCELYDQGKLPAGLSTKLRANRRDLLLPDSHGQIWMQLALASQHDKLLFRGKKAEVESEMLDLLQLRDTPRFPISRLITLWQNERWQPIITRWCETAVGRELFNISTWEWMASCRIDDYWFAPLNRVLEILSLLPAKDAAKRLHAGDWQRLVTMRPEGHGNAPKSAMQQCFFPSREGKPRIGGHRPRGFLSAFTDEEYKDTYRFLVDNPSIFFPDVRALLRTSKEEGRMMIQVLTHVVIWLNPKPVAVFDRRRKNKKLLREDLVLELECLRPTAEPGVTAPGSVDSSEALSVQLEREVLDFTRQRIGELKTPVVGDFLEVMPDPAADDHARYAGRFEWDFWVSLLALVKNFVGDEYQPWWTAKASKGKAAQVQAEPSNLARKLSILVKSVPEIAENPALRGEDAIERLAFGIDEFVVRWAMTQGQKALSGGMMSLMPEKKNLVAAATERYRKHIELLARQRRHPPPMTIVEEDSPHPESPSLPPLRASSPTIDEGGRRGDGVATARCENAIPCSDGGHLCVTSDIPGLDMSAPSSPSTAVPPRSKAKPGGSRHSPTEADRSERIGETRRGAEPWTTRASSTTRLARSSKQISNGDGGRKPLPSAASRPSPTVHSSPPWANRVQAKAAPKASATL